MPLIDKGTPQFSSSNRRLICVTFPVAAALSILSLVIGFFVPQFTLVYLSGAHMLGHIAIFALCLPLLKLQNQNARRLIFTFAAMGLLRVLSSIWLLFETLFLGIPISFPNSSIIIETAANITMIVGLTLVVTDQRKRSLKHILGLLLLCILFGVCIFPVYLTNIMFNPPLFPAIGAGTRILFSFLIAILAWSFFYNEDPSNLIIGQLARILLLLASIIQLLGHTLFAFQYATGFTTISTIIYAGSGSDIILLFAQFVILIAVLSIFIEIIEAKPGPRPLSFRYSAALTILILSLLVSTILTTTIIAMTLISQVLLSFISPIDSMIVMQTIVGGLLIGVAIIIIIGGLLASTISDLTMRPLEKLNVQIQSASSPTIVAYKEPRELIFTELQSLSDSFRVLIERLKRAHSELRSLSPPQRRSDTTGQRRITDVDSDYHYIYNEVSNYCQIILTYTEMIAESLRKDSQARKQIDNITSSVKNIHELLDTIQMLRNIEVGDFPDFSQMDIKNVLSRVIKRMKEDFSHRKMQITLKIPKVGCKVLANDFLEDIFTIILRNAIHFDSQNEVAIEILVSRISEQGKSYWRTMFTAFGWVLSDEEKATIFHRDLSQYRTTGPDLVKAGALVEAFQGKIRVGDRVPGDYRYGTILVVLLPVYEKKSGKSTQARRTK